MYKTLVEIVDLIDEEILIEELVIKQGEKKLEIFFYETLVEDILLQNL